MAVATSARRATAARRPAPERVAPRLRVARPTTSSTPTRRARVTLRPLAIAAGLIVGSLLAVVVGNMALASGQLHLEQLQQRLAQVESAMSSSQEQYQQLRSPANVALSAQRHGFVSPVATYTLPYVADLSHRLPAPLFSSGPCCEVTPRR